MQLADRAVQVQKAKVLTLAQSCVKENLNALSEPFNLAVSFIRDHAHKSSSSHYKPLEILEALGDFFEAAAMTRDVSYLIDADWKDIVSDDHAIARLQVGTDILKGWKSIRSGTSSDYKQALIDEGHRNLIGQYLKKPLTPTSYGQRHSRELFQRLPTLYDIALNAVPEDNLTLSTEFKSTSWLLVRFVAALEVAALTKNMSVNAVTEITQMVTRAFTVGTAERYASRFLQLIENASVMVSADEELPPPPLGRPALLYAFKTAHFLNSVESESLTGKKPLHVVVPHNTSQWEYLAQRIHTLMKVRDPSERARRLEKALNLFFVSLASEPMRKVEENYFRQISLNVAPETDEYRAFYRNHYGVDNGPGGEGSVAAHTTYQETAKLFRAIAANRYSLNQRKAYCIENDQGKWLLEKMVEEAGGTAVRLKVKDINLYPGPGLVVSDLRVEEAIDLSTDKVREVQLSNFPWLRAGEKALPGTSLSFFRGFIAVSRKTEDFGKPVSDAWKAGVIDNEPMVALWFNDHFHNDRLPEVRMWLVPEKVFAKKMELALEEHIEVNALDLTPEGLLEEAERQNLQILSVGTSSVLFGGLANARPFGSAPAHLWETSSSWKTNKWQDPFHIHRGVSVEEYSQHASWGVRAVLHRSHEEHLHLKPSVEFFHDLLSSFHTIEEHVAKGYIDREEGPARLTFDSPPPQLSPSQDSVIPVDKDASQSQKDQDPPKDDNETFVEPRSRSGFFQDFINERNRTVRRKPHAQPNAFPILTLQITRPFVSQPDTPWISGADMVLHFPDGTSRSLYPSVTSDGVIHEEVVLTEHLEAEWLQEFVSRFAPNNIPRIFLP